MTDLEALFRPLIDESAPYREPVDVIEARVSERRVRRRRQRAQHRFGAAFLAVALIATAVGVVHAREKSAAPARPAHVATTTPPPTAPAAVVPAGWSTYDYGLARLSIPPGWGTVGACPGPHELVLSDPSLDIVGCPAGGTPNITVAPLPPVSAIHASYVPNAMINGVAYEQVFPRCLSVACGLIVYVPVLKVALSFSQGVDANAILKTLTYSTYARVLQQPFGPVPASWKTVTFDGFSVRVPADWRTVDLSKTGFCYPAPNTVYVGTPTLVSNCAFLPLQPSRASLQLQRGNPGAATTSGPSRWSHNRLLFVRQVGISPLATTLSLQVYDVHRTLFVSLGLGPDPAVARAILGSLKPIDP